MGILLDRDINISKNQLEYCYSYSFQLFFMVGIQFVKGLSVESDSFEGCPVEDFERHTRSIERGDPTVPCC